MRNKVKLFVMDVDGTMTDGKIYMGQTGELFKSFDIKDGYAIHELLPNNGIRTAIITGRISQIVENRAGELGVDLVIQGEKDKLNALKKMAEKLEIYPHEIAYIGDDIIDLQPMEWCGVSGCPANAIEEIKMIADYSCKSNGGDGAVREFAEWLLRS